MSFDCSVSWLKFFSVIGEVPLVDMMLPPICSSYGFEQKASAKETKIFREHKRENWYVCQAKSAH